MFSHVLNTKIVIFNANIKNKNFRYDHNTNSGEVQYMVKYLEAKAFYEAKGRLLSIDLGSAGVVEGNASKFYIQKLTYFYKI